MAAALFAGSYLSRTRGAHNRGTVLSALGLTVLGASGALGGHLSYAQGAGAFRWQKPDPVQQNLTTPRPGRRRPGQFVRTNPLAGRAGIRRSEMVRSWSGTS